MANSTLFRSKSQSRKQPNRTNAAGGKTFYQGDEHALCQYVVTGTFANSYYASAKEQLDKVKNLCRNASSDLLARAAVYGHENARMKDVPAFLLAVLAPRS